MFKIMSVADVNIAEVHLLHLVSYIDYFSNVLNLLFEFFIAEVVNC